MPAGEPQTGAEGRAERRVQRTDCASAMADGAEEAFPEVFATIGMIGLMELAGARVLQPHLAPGELSVGVVVDVKHTAPTPVGGRVVARARYTGRAGKLYAFEVVAEDEGGEVGRGVHHRAIVTTERLLEGARRRLRP